MGGICHKGHSYVGWTCDRCEEQANLLALRELEERRQTEEREERDAAKQRDYEGRARRETQAEQDRRDAAEREERRRWEREEDLAEREAEEEAREARREEKRFLRAHRLEIEAEDYLRRAAVLLKQHDPVHAESLIRRALEVAPHWPWCWLLSATADRWLGRLPVASARRAVGLAASEGLSLEPATANHDSTPWIDEFARAVRGTASALGLGNLSVEASASDVFLFWLAWSGGVDAVDLDAMIRRGEGRLDAGTFELGLALGNTSSAAAQKFFDWVDADRTKEWRPKDLAAVRLCLVRHDPRLATLRLCTYARRVEHWPKWAGDSGQFERTLEESTKRLGAFRRMAEELVPESAAEITSAIAEGARGAVLGVARWPEPAESFNSYKLELSKTRKSLEAFQVSVHRVTGTGIDELERALSEQSRLEAGAEAAWLARGAIRISTLQEDSQTKRDQAYKEVQNDARAWARAALSFLSERSWWTWPFAALSSISRKRHELDSWLVSQKPAWTGHDETDRKLLACHVDRLTTISRAWLPEFGRYLARAAWVHTTIVFCLAYVGWLALGPGFGSAPGDLVAVLLRLVYFVALALVLLTFIPTLVHRWTFARTLARHNTELARGRGLSVISVEANHILGWRAMVISLVLFGALMVIPLGIALVNAHAAYQRAATTRGALCRRDLNGLIPCVGDCFRHHGVRRADSLAAEYENNRCFLPNAWELGDLERNCRLDDHGRPPCVGRCFGYHNMLIGPSLGEQYSLGRCYLPE